MSKNQGGIIQYVDFHKDVNVSIISEKKSKKNTVQKIALKTKTLAKNEIQHDSSNSTPKTAKIAKFPKPSENKAIVIKKTATKSSKKIKSSKKTIKHNPIKVFFEHNKSTHDIPTILSNEKPAKVVILKDITNEKIHKKAINVIIKAMKSSRKFKEQTHKAS
jgi:hypothetical protein